MGCIVPHMLEIPFFPLAHIAADRRQAAAALPLRALAAALPVRRRHRGGSCCAARLLWPRSALGLPQQRRSSSVRASASSGAVTAVRAGADDERWRYGRHRCHAPGSADISSAST